MFGHVVTKPANDPEVFLKQIRSALYDSHGISADPDSKYRWFFYADDLKPLWIGKHSAKEQRTSSAVLNVRAEEDAIDIEDVTDIEGGKEEVKGYRIRRSAKLAYQAKERDKFTCRACNFHFAEDHQTARGVIIALEDDQRIRRALRVAQNIEFFRYEVSFRLFKALL